MRPLGVLLLYTDSVEKNSARTPASAEDSLKALEADLGEPILYRATGRFLAAPGLEGVPLDSWGLVVLTPTRLVFRHYPQAHPLFGGKSEEILWEVRREVFDSCTARTQGFWSKLFSGTPNHLALTGPGVLLALEPADDLAKLPAAWSAPAP